MPATRAIARKPGVGCDVGIRVHLENPRTTLRVDAHVDAAVALAAHRLPRVERQPLAAPRSALGEILAGQHGQQRRGPRRCRCPTSTDRTRCAISPLASRRNRSRRPAEPIASTMPTLTSRPSMKRWTRTSSHRSCIASTRAASAAHVPHDRPLLDAERRVLRGGLADRRETDGRQRGPGRDDRPSRHRKLGALEERVDDVLAQAEGSRPARAPCIRNAEQLEHGDDGGLVAPRCRRCPRRG